MEQEWPVASVAFSDKPKKTIRLFEINADFEDESFFYLSKDPIAD